MTREKEQPTDEVPPLVVQKRVQWRNLSKYGKWAGAAVAAFLVAVVPVINWVRVQNAETAVKIAAAEAEAKAKREVTKTANTVLGTTANYAEALEKRVAASEAEIASLKAAIARAAPASVRAAARRRVAAAPVQRPAPLPRDLKSAEAQLGSKGPSPRPPVITPLPDASAPPTQ